MIASPSQQREQTLTDTASTESSQVTAQIATGASLSRRTVIASSISTVALVPVLAELALASEATSQPDAARRTRTFRIDRKYLLFPINDEAVARRVSVVQNGRALRSFTASLGLPAHWWAHLDVTEWRGQPLTLTVEPDSSPSAALAPKGRGPDETDNAALVAAIRTSTDIWSPETLYLEPTRPLFHFSVQRGWTNDPIGLVYHNGKYHLFFIHNPYGLRPGNTHWGHAVSTDLVHWEELPIALYPRGENDLPYSGSAIVDHGNTSGWAQNGRPPIVIAYTSTGRGECIVYSKDEGVTWQEFEGNPVVKHNGRDPRLIWHDKTKQWIMAVYSLRPAADPAATERHGIAFYTSPDLKAWRERSWIEGFIECPDLFALPIDGDTGRTKWVLSCAQGYYVIGEFDGARFIPETSRLPAPAGQVPWPTPQLPGPMPVFWAAQTFTNHPDGHIVQIGWARVDTVNEPFNQMMSFPTNLTLRTTADGVRLCREPVDAIRSLRTRTYDFPAGPLTRTPLLTELNGAAWDIEAVINVGVINFPILMCIAGDEYIYHPASQILTSKHDAMPIALSDGQLHLRILVDRTTVEIFGDRGQAYGMFIRSDPGGNAPLELRTTYGEVQLAKMKVHALRSAWKRERGLGV